ncbi:porin [Ideonella livida]|uniref:Porin n=1 Tax=Ideonella livida TaxID=2707176 RepID=A0A7C9PGI8_9BURK|nr:porin [Ideonella livida]NDY90830.1 porin [Ideonella livida]
MKKALIPAAVMLTLAGAAQAQVAVYGLIDLSYGKNDIYPGIEAVNDGKASFYSGGDGNHGNSTSRFGIKGSMDVGSGYKANFKLESAGIDSTGNVGTPFFARQAWAGLSGSFGEIRAGRQDSVAFQTMIGFDANGAANAASAWGNAGVGPWAPGRQIGVGQYISPNMGGVTVMASLQVEGDAMAQAGGTTGKANAGLGVTYAAGPVAAAVAYQGKTVKAGEDFMSVAGSYDFGAAKVALTYTDGGDVAKGGSGAGYGLSISAPVGGFTVGLLYGENSDTDAKATEVFINREVLKGTYAYVDFGQAKNAPGSTSTAGKTKSAYAAGMIFTF